jgi:hypothetical protein
MTYVPAFCMTSTATFTAQFVMVAVTINLAAVFQLFIVFKRARLAHLQTMNAGARTSADPFLVPEPRHGYSSNFE